MIRIYEVGGSIRDKLLYGPSYIPKDIDYAVEASSYEEMLFYVREVLGCRVFLERPEFGSLRAKNSSGEVCDYSLARKGIYREGDIHICSIVEDLSRRDATCNAIARCVDTGELIDPFGGATDINNRMIRPVGSATDRCREDGLRTLRYMRFHITKDMHLSNDLLDPIWECSTYLGGTSIDRIRDELSIMFKYSTYKTLIALEELVSKTALSNILSRGIWLSPTTKHIGH
jgi:tRNA nucleotidyltransferase (CCA-adding enzyme)